MRRCRRLAAIILIGLVSITGMAVIPAQADSKNIHITGTEGLGVRLQPEPRPVLIDTPRIPDGASPDYLCYTRGARIGGTAPGTYTDVWFKVNWQGRVGYYTSFYDDVPLSKQGDLEGNYGIRRCEVSADINQSPANDLKLDPAPTVYHRQAAATWAKQHAGEFQIQRFADCTWFVSQALWYGGFHQTAGWNGHTQHGNKLAPLPGTVSATAAPELYNYLRANVPVQVVPLTPDRFRSNAVPEAQLGDVIFYNWHEDAGDSISHAAMVVDIAPVTIPKLPNVVSNPSAAPTLSGAGHGQP